MADAIDEVEKELLKAIVSKKRDEESDGEASTTGNGIGPDGQVRVGVLIRLLTAVQEEKEYRQALLTGDFIDDEEADRVAAAIEERLRYGVSIRPILDWISARCSVNSKGHGKSRAILGVEGLTHSTLTFNGRENKKNQKETN